MNHNMSIIRNFIFTYLGAFVICLYGPGMKLCSDFHVAKLIVLEIFGVVSLFKRKSILLRC